MATVSGCRVWPKNVVACDDINLGQIANLNSHDRKEKTVDEIEEFVCETPEETAVKIE